MRKSAWLGVLVAAVLVIVGGTLIAQAETHSVKVKVKVMEGDDQTVEVDHNGTAEVISLADLADGESRDFVAGEHTITVRRDGDQLNVLMDGEEFKNLNVHAGDSHSNMVWVAKDGDCEEEIHIAGHDEMVGKRVMVFTGDGDEGEHKVIRIHCEGDDDCEDLEKIKIDIEEIHGEHGAENVFIKAHGAEHAGHPIMIRTSGVVSNRVLFKCEEDGTVLNIEKEKATQESYMCPVCGRAMEQSDEPEIKVMSYVTEIEEEE